MWRGVIIFNENKAMKLVIDNFDHSNISDNLFKNEIMNMTCVCDESSLPNLEIMQEKPNLYSFNIILFR